MILKTEKKTINDVLPESWEGEGIISQINNPPWTNYINSEDLDIEFIAKYGNKPISPLLNHYVDDDNTVSVVAKNKIATIIYNKFKVKWTRLFNLLLLDYDPLKPYRITETGLVEKEDGSITDSRDITKSGTITDDGSNVHSGTVSDDGDVTHTGTIVDDGETHNTGTDTTVLDQDTSNKLNTYGFDTVDENGVPQNKSVATNDSTNTNTKNLTNTDDNTRTFNEANTNDNVRTYNEKNDVDNKRTVSETNSDDNTRDIDVSRTRNLTKEGNFGNITYQDLINQEIKTWSWNYVETVLNDINSVLCLNIYEL